MYGAYTNATDIVEEASKHKVVICPPVLVYATLKTIMLAMHQRDIEENAKEIAKVGNECIKNLFSPHAAFRDSDNRDRTSVQASHSEGT